MKRFFLLFVFSLIIGCLSSRKSGTDNLTIPETEPVTKYHSDASTEIILPDRKELIFNSETPISVVPISTPTCVQTVEIPPTPVQIQIPEKPHIKRCMNYYLVKYRRDFDDALDRRTQYCSLIENELCSRKMPDYLKWIPLVETWFCNESRSHENAVGLWQLIPATAKSFGLRIDEWVDERNDPYQATHAALDVFEYLYEKMDDWLLATAAYNAGEGCINRAIRKTGSRDYWVLARKKAIPSQTRFYVAAVLALQKIEEQSGTLGIAIPDCVQLNWVDHYLTSQVDLKWLAASSDITLSEIRQLNPALKRTWTPPHGKPFALKIPKDKAKSVVSALASDHEHCFTECIVHVIKPGDTLWNLASEYHSTIDAIMTANELKKKTIFAGKILLIPSNLTWDGLLRD